MQTAATTSDNFAIAVLPSIPPVECPCGQSRRAFASPDNELATIHLVDISVDARTHYHKRMTEIYTFLEVEGDGGFIELDGRRIAVRPLMSVMIRPGCRHRAVGKMRIL